MLLGRHARTLPANALGSDGRHHLVFWHPTAKVMLGPVVNNHTFLVFPKLESLSVDGLVKLLECKLPNSNSYPKEIWKAFFAKVAGILDEALVQYSGKVGVVLQSYPTL